MIKVLNCLFISILLVSVVSVAKDTPLKVGDTAPDFTLQDVEEKQHNLKKLRGKYVFLIMGNRKIRKEDDKWAEAFKKDYKKNQRVAAYIIADLRSVPGFIPKRFIRSQLKRNPPPVTFLLDWKGQVHQRYHTDKKKPNLYLISPQGKIVFHREENFKLEIYADLKKQIDALLTEKP